MLCAKRWLRVRDESSELMTRFSFSATSIPERQESRLLPSCIKQRYDTRPVATCAPIQATSRHHRQTFRFDCSIVAHVLPCEMVSSSHMVILAAAPLRARLDG